MKKFIQSILFGYRENTQAKTIQGGFTTSFKGGTAKERFTALRTLQNEVKCRKFGIS